jgi:hypothetical protein
LNQMNNLISFRFFYRNIKWTDTTNLSSLRSKILSRGGQFLASYLPTKGSHQRLHSWQLGRQQGSTPLEVSKMVEDGQLVLLYLSIRLPSKIHYFAA